MMLLEWVQFIVGGTFILLGLGIITIEVIGVFKLKYVMNRMHAAALGDTLGLALSLIGLIILSDDLVIAGKLLLVIILLWLASPVSSHLIARLEVKSNERIKEHCQMFDMEETE